MKPARLTSGLLARKGGATPLAGAYGGTNLEPLIGLFGRGATRPTPAWAGTAEPARPPVPAAQRPMPAPARAPMQTSHATIEPMPLRRNAPVRLGLRLDPDSHARLRIMAARKGVRPQDLVRDALQTVLATAKDDCPCVRGELACCGKADC
ncbi:MAG TPA: hypothetical protein PKA13_11355 [Geminicoccaceae bacterium]|nr:hypothetical protein [Geminicoccus sp.]HMU50361.1 hypothetical protein [Geminicoccaceae bacterium]